MLADEIDTPQKKEKKSISTFGNFENSEISQSFRFEFHESKNQISTHV